MTSPDTTPITFFVAGVQFRPGSVLRTVRDELLGVADYTTFPVTLVGEPSNQYDDYAVKVMAGGQHIGYVPKPLNINIWSLRDAGYKPAAKLVGFDASAKTYEMFKIEVTYTKP